MTREHDGPDRLGFEPEDLDGHTIEQLTDYLDAGRTPVDPSIEQSAGCQLALDALERLHRLTPELVAADTAAEPEANEDWVQRILGGIVLDARAGRRIPFTAPDHAELGITEGAVRGLIRATESTMPGLLIGRSRLDGDVTTPGAPIRVEVDVSVAYGRPLAILAAELRTEIGRRLASHTELNIAAIDIVIQDVHPALAREGGPA
ncbi:Asp23/Gls24 family envelope stress response protein [Compostimonas suwonensis]|uniref:Cell envelope-related Asp23 family protein n=1 Tax=Compostimonas suwonensis TaxID=1048394 RepID=A0A2M9C0H7_9MICO|nr:Asp23/Gls24 family envelope stress response protein [Compostimonas suwonensis]PJJ63800.1 hypothetical protein CLV54_1476 [Compostimonas suwonensis]